MTLDWSSIRSGDADAMQGAIVELCGWMIPLDPTADKADYFLLAADAPCCGGCLPRDPLSSIEVYAAAPCAPQERAVTFTGRLQRLIDDPAGWRYQLIDATPLDFSRNARRAARVVARFSRQVPRWVSQPARLDVSRVIPRSRVRAQPMPRARTPLLRELLKRRTARSSGALPTR